MARVTTVLSPREAIIRLYNSLRVLYKHTKGHTASAIGKRSDWDKILNADLNTFGVFEKKLSDAFLQQVLADAKMLGDKAKQDPKLIPAVQKSLKDIEGILRETKRHQWLSMKRAMYLRKLAKHLGAQVRGEERNILQQEKKIHSKLTRQLQPKELQAAQILKLDAQKVRKAKKEEAKAARMLKMQRKKAKVFNRRAA